MGFDLGKFETEQYKSRASAVPVPELKSFFADNTDAVWTVRGLTGAEVSATREAKRRARDMEAVLAKLTDGAAREKAEAVIEALGLGGAGESPEDFIQRLSLLEIGSVDPKIQRYHAVKVSEIAPLVFYRLTDEIFRLTGQGKLPESSASGQTPESGTVSPSAPGAE